MNASIIPSRTLLTSSFAAAAIRACQVLAASVAVFQGQECHGQQPLANCALTASGNEATACGSSGSWIVSFEGAYRTLCPDPYVADWYVNATVGIVVWTNTISDDGSRNPNQILIQASGLQPGCTIVVSATINWGYSENDIQSFGLTNTIDFGSPDNSGCSGTCSQSKSSGSAGPGASQAVTSPLGSASVVNNQGPQISFNLGGLSSQQTAGTLALYGSTATASLASPAALTVPYLRTSSNFTIDVVTDGNGVIEQVNSAQGLINVTNIANGYQLQMFYGNNVGVKTNGLYGMSGSPFETWTVQNPSGNTNILVVSDTLRGAQYTYTFTSVSGNPAWQMTDSNGLRTVLDWQATNNWTLQTGLFGAASNFVEEILSGSTPVQQVQKIYGWPLSGGVPVLLQEIDGTGATTNVTTYYYNSSYLVEQINYPNGNWVAYSYDNQNRLTTTYSAYGNSPPPAPGNTPTGACKVLTQLYNYLDTNGQYLGPPDGNGVVFFPSTPRTEITCIWDASSNHCEISRLYRGCPYINEIDEYKCPTPGGVPWNDPSVLVTQTLYFVDSSDPNTVNQMQWQLRPDGTATYYQYQEDNGVLTNIVVQTGAPVSSSGPTNIYHGTQTSTALNSLGQPTVVTTQSIVGGNPSIVLSQLTYTYLDTLQRNYQVVDLANRTNQYLYSCCGLESSTDPDGVTTGYTYDDLQRQVTSTVYRGASNVLTSTTYDAASRVIAQQITGTSGPTFTNQQTAYDVLGRVIAQTNALGGVTTTSYALINGNSQLVTTVTDPDHGTTVTTNYSDGGVQGAGGTAVAPMLYQYGAELDQANNNIWREYSLTIKVAANGGTNEWSKTDTDGLGRSFLTTYATNGTSFPRAVSYYNNLGQLTNRTDPDGVATLYGYDDQGRQDLTDLAMNSSGQIQYSGLDQITLTTNDVVAANGVNVNRTQVFVWASANYSTPTQISTAETSVEGLTNWSIIYNNGAATATNTRITVYAGGGNRYVTNLAPDGSYAVSVYQYGLLQSTTRYDTQTNQISGTTYGYDGFWRQNAATDARNGTTTSYFNNVNLVTETITPSPGGAQPAEVTINYYDQTGRLLGSQLPDGTYTTNSYYPTGWLAASSGSRTYAVGYSYDGQGRMKTMTNWGQAGVEVTTWSYDPYRGWLTSKLDNSGHGPAYTRTAAGRLKTRTWARGTNTSYAYNQAGALAKTTYSDGTPAVGNGYDRRGRLNSVTNGAMVTMRTFNDAGEVLSETYVGGLLDGLSVVSIYDGLLRRTNVAVWTNVALWSCTNNFDAASRLLTMSDGTNAAAYSYVANSPLVDHIAFAHGGTSEMTTSNLYDYLNRRTQVANANGSGAALDLHGYAYNAANQRTSATNADGSYWVYGYDALGQVTNGVKKWANNNLVAGEQFGYGFDTIGNRTKTLAGGDQNGGGLRQASYTANALNQYTGRTVPGAVDVIGSVTNTGSVWVNQIIPYRTNNYFWEALPVTNGPGPVYQTVTTLAALTNGNPNNAWYGTTNIGHVFVPETPESYSYDLDGNLLSDGHWNYTWDGENRLIALTNNANIALAGQYALTFAYDYQGRRIQKLVCTNSGLAYVPEYTNRFVYDGWNLSAILNPGGSIAASFMWGTDLSGSMQGASGVGGLLAENLAGNGVQFVAYDGNGNVAALVNAATGAISANYEYGPFGEVVRANGPMAKLNPFMFSTKFYDWESGLYYYGFRYYNPSTGRWLSRDPLGELGGVNLYVIGCNIGPNGYDVLGQWSAWSIVSGVVQVISGGLQIYSGVGVVTGVMQVFQGCCSVFEGVTGTNPMVQFSSWVAQEAGVDPLTGARIYHGVEAFVGIASLKSCVGDIKLLVQGQREITETSDIVQWLPGKGWQGITYVKKRTVNASYAIRLWIAGKVVVDLHDAFETIDPPPDSGPEN